MNEEGATEEAEGRGAESPSAALDALDYYTLLGVAEDASRADIRAAFRRFALRYHPDRFAGEAPELAQRALAIYRRGTEAVDVLCDVDQRRAYDAVLARGEKRLTEDATLTLRRTSPGPARPEPPRAAALKVQAGPPPSPPLIPRPPQAQAMQAPPMQPQTEPKPAIATFGKPGAGVKATRPRPARPSKTSRRAMPAVRDAAPPPKPAPPPLRIQSPQAKAFFERATKAKAEGDLRSAWRMLKAAVEAEPDNAALESELYAVERNFRP